jgi:hypothetical protein
MGTRAATGRSERRSRWRPAPRSSASARRLRLPAHMCRPGNVPAVESDRSLHGTCGLHRTLCLAPSSSSKRHSVKRPPIQHGAARARAHRGGSLGTHKRSAVDKRCLFACGWRPTSDRRSRLALIPACCSRPGRLHPPSLLNGARPWKCRAMSTSVLTIPRHEGRPASPTTAGAET